MENLVLEKKSHKKRNIALGITALLIVGALAAAVMFWPEPPIAEEIRQDIVVGTISPSAGNISVMSEYIGTMEPLRQVTVYPRAAGEVLAVNFKVGDTVKAGDILFELDSETLERNIAQQQAAMGLRQAAASIQLEQAQNARDDYYQNTQDGNNAAIVQAEANVETAKGAVREAEVALSTARAAARDARDAYRDYRDAFGLDEYDDDDDDFEIMYEIEAPAEQLRAARTQAELREDAAQLVVDRAKMALANAETAYDLAKIQAYEAAENSNFSVQAAEVGTNFSAEQIALETLQKTLEDYKVAAPIDGVIERRGVEPLDMASQQTPAFVISDKNSMTVSFKIPKSSFGHIGAGDGITLENDGETFAGRVTEISTMVDASGLFTVEAEIANPPENLYTGATVKIRAQSRKVENALLIPLSALHYDNGAPYAYIAENGFAKKTLLETGIYDAENVQVISGLNYSDSIISTWSSRLADGVEIVLAGEGEVK